MTKVKGTEKKAVKVTKATKKPETLKKAVTSPKSAKTDKTPPRANSAPKKAVVAAAKPAKKKPTRRKAYVDIEEPAPEPKHDVVIHRRREFNPKDGRHFEILFPMNGQISKLGPLSKVKNVNEVRGKLLPVLCLIEQGDARNGRALVEVVPPILEGKITTETRVRHAGGTAHTPAKAVELV